MKAMSARPPVRVTSSYLMILKSFQLHLQLIVVNNNLEGIPAFLGAVNPWKLCLQETLHCSFGACSSRPRTSILALRIQLQRSAMNKRWEHFLFRKLSGLPTPATTLTCVIQTQPALKSGSRRLAAMRCRSIGYSGFVHSVHQSDQSFSGNRWGCLCKHAIATANLRAKLKSPKLSSWEDRSPSRSAANNQKCSESSSRSLSPCPLSYSNPCITSVYASHLLGSNSTVSGESVAQRSVGLYWRAIGTEK